MERTNTSKAAGLIGTITFHGLLLLLLLLFNLQPQQPLPPEEGILINFGDGDVGTGTIEPSMADQASSAAAASSSAKQDETPMTQDFEDAPAIAVSKKQDKKKPEVKKSIQPSTSTNAKQAVESTAPVEKPREVNKKALFPGRSTSINASQGEGEGGGRGNQGNPNGSPDSHSRIGGSVGGNGTSFSLSGRKIVGGLPHPDYGVQASGKVIVAITVDQNGNVTKATYSPRGSTTQDARLVNAALSAAKKARFNVDNDAPPSQTGQITYIFNLQ